MLRKINVEGVEGYFLPKKQGEQLKNFLQNFSEMKVIQNADNS